MYTTGSVIVNFCPEKFFKRSIVQMGISLYQRVLLWMFTKRRWRGKNIISISKDERRKAARASHIMLDIGSSTSYKKVYRDILSVTFPTAVLHRVEVDNQFKGTLLNGQYLSLNTPLDEFMAACVNEWGWFLIASKGNKYYDFLQLLSFVINLPIWLLFPHTFGKEIITILSIGKGNEVCSSGALAALRYGESMTLKDNSTEERRYLKVFNAYIKIRASKSSHYMKNFATSMVSPALFLIEGNWKV